MKGEGLASVKKIRAYRLQDEGLDTVDANLALGHGIDERDFQDAVEILSDLGIKNVVLLTNNPAKVKALEDAKVSVKTQL